MVLASASQLHFVPSGIESLSWSHCDNWESHSSDKEIIARIKKVEGSNCCVFSLSFKPKYFGH